MPVKSLLRHSYGSSTWPDDDDEDDDIDDEDEIVRMMRMIMNLASTHSIRDARGAIHVNGDPGPQWQWFHRQGGIVRKQAPHLVLELLQAQHGRLTSVLKGFLGILNL